MIVININIIMIVNIGHAPLNSKIRVENKIYIIFIKRLK